MPQPLHVLHITYDMSIGGTEQVIRNLVEALDKSQFISSILCIDGKIGLWGKELQDKGYRLFCLKRLPGFDRKLIKEIRALIRRENIDIVHCHQYTPYTYGWFGALFTGKPVLFTEHGRFYPDSRKFKRRLINPILQRMTAAITSISQATKAALVGFENLNGSKIEVIYNGIADTHVAPNAKLRSELGLVDSDIVIGTISRLDVIKNHPMILRALQRSLKLHPNLRLLIVGDGPMRDELHQLSHDLGVKDHVIFTGLQPKPQAYLAIMDIFLLPSLSEGTSMTLLEAMCFAKPSIATAVGGTPEILVDKKTGLLIANKDEDGLVKAIQILANNNELRIQYGGNARATYKKSFTLDIMVRNYEKLYRRIVN